MQLVERRFFQSKKQNLQKHRLMPNKLENTDKTCFFSACRLGQEMWFVSKCTPFLWCLKWRWIVSLRVRKHYKPMNSHLNVSCGAVPMPCGAVQTGRSRVKILKVWPPFVYGGGKNARFFFHSCVIAIISRWFDDEDVTRLTQASTLTLERPVCTAPHGIGITPHETFKWEFMAL